MSSELFRPPAPTPESRIHGCLLGGALGDSLGYAVEFDDIAVIRSRFGPAGLQDFSALDGVSHFSDDTQMTLYTVDGLVEALEWANDGTAADANACVWLAYLRWLATQGVPVPPSAPAAPPRWIDGQEALKHRRAPGKACLSGLATGEMGTVYRPVNPDSKGCGTVMRSAPFGLIPHIPAESVYKLSSDAAALTHGHRSARQSAGAFSLLIHALVGGQSLLEAAEYALNHARQQSGPEPALISRLERALQLAEHPGPEAGNAGRLSPEDLVQELGEGWVAEEALAVALYAVLATAPASSTAPETAVTGPRKHFRDAIALAVNHSGDSDSTGSIAGNILGAFYGEECLPAAWLESLEAPEVIRGMARQLVSVTGS
jgi:ADP-ribosylglycohydrolase